VKAQKIHLVPFVSGYNIDKARKLQCYHTLSTNTAMLSARIYQEWHYICSAPCQATKNLENFSRHILSNSQGVL
jgi:hypothetical protein